MKNSGSLVDRTRPIDRQSIKFVHIKYETGDLILERRVTKLVEISMISLAIRSALMKPYNSFSESDAFFESNSAPATKIVLFKPENAYSQIVSAVKLRCKSSSVSRWNRFWDSLINLFCGSSEPRIDRKIAHDGTPYFHVYDPVTRRSMTLSSEQELRVWIDQRYYQ